MRTSTQPVAVKTEFGTLYVAVDSAEEHRYHDMERGSVTDLHPVLWVCSDPEFTGELDKGALKIRGRAYGVHVHLYYADLSHLSEADGTPIEVWHRSGCQPYQGGFRNARGGAVGFRTPTYDLMRDAAKGAAQEFADTHPGWEDLSTYLLHRDDAARKEAEADCARKEAAKRAEDARQLTEQRDVTGMRVRPELLSMLQG